MLWEERERSARGPSKKADTTAYSTAKIAGDYAFGLAGYDSSSNRVTFAGRLTGDGAGNFSNAAGDANVHGTVGSATLVLLVTGYPTPPMGAAL